MYSILISFNFYFYNLNLRLKSQRNIEQLNAHLIAEEIAKIRKMLPVEYRQKTDLFETQLETLKNVRHVSKVLRS